ncbi:hypothetical protein [Lactococcus lactis]|uniref:hypothetical protein n=1 Tax=Lactococcus lactis TaxID=1358 RepID=UPI0022B8B278|nr:hypothetical protein [Lactococcus lactis]MCZ8492177.1 hypothetical protein [Lactococcus lactis]
MSEEIEVTINVTGEEAVKILNAKEQEITYLKNEIARLSQQTQYSEPQVTIPKSIADELEKYDFELTSKGLMYRNMGGTLVEFSRVTYDEIPQLIVQTIAGNYRIVFAYLAGKALGVDLVKVGEG